MTDTPPPSPTRATPPAPKLEQRRRRPILSAVWLVPLVAILVAGAIAWQSYRNRGELISISFPDASGVTVGETTLRYREVAVGIVEDVGFSADLDSVNVYVRVNADIAPYLDESASFWIVRPEVSARGVEGLTTILSGTYIEGTWDSVIGDRVSLFGGNERAPIVPPGVEGTPIVLRAADSARLDAGAPILYRGIEVGEVATPRLSGDGSEIRIDAFVRAPYDRQITTATRFWDSSGISVSLGGSGVELNVGSLAAILEGGLVFDTLVSGGQPIEEGYVFDIFDDRESALTSTFEAPATRSVRFSALFPSAAAGLVEGAPVRFRGVRVGAVSSITGFIRPDRPGAQPELLAVLSLQPSRMGMSDMQTDLEGIDFVGDLVESGLRAQLVSTSLLGSDLAVELVDAPDAPAEGLEIGIADNPLIPTIEGETSSIAASAEGVLSRINDLPIEELLFAATDLLNNVNRIASDSDTRAIPGAALAALEQGGGLVRDARAIVSSPQTASTLADVQSIAADLRGIAADIAARELGDTLAGTLDSASAAAANIAAGTANLQDLSNTALVLFDDAGRLIASEATQAIPENLNAAVEAGRAALAAPEIAAILNDTAAATASIRALTDRIGSGPILTQVESALSSIDAAARDVATGTADIATLRASIDSAAAGADALINAAALQTLPDRIGSIAEGADGLVGDARAIVAAPEIRTLLADVPRITGALRDVATRLSEGPILTQVETALANVDAAARDLAAGTADIATLRASIDAAVGGAETLLTDPSLQALPDRLGGIASNADGLIGDARALLATPEIQAVLTDLPAITEDIRIITRELAQAQAVAALTSTLQAAERAATSIADGTANLPALSASAERVTAEVEVLARNLNDLTTKANGLALDQLVNATTDLMQTADAFLSSDEAGDVPVVLSETLQEVRATIEQIRTGGTLDNLNATLSSASGAADSIRVAATDLPALVNRLQALTTGATTVLSTYDSDSRVAQELFATLRAATRAADDVSSLARTIERNPNSLLLGR
ncbi:MlaD family protein [Jannaschia sp. LMIT008]|uniref:MlaD family protein n=1 Tax=Jannaschia maritima TaxID=3032585 RepID=UPI002810AD3E|nr:MlaD family protein [Jannaschia sp. LMIT008]